MLIFVLVDGAHEVDQNTSGFCLVHFFYFAMKNSKFDITSLVDSFVGNCSTC